MHTFFIPDALQAVRSFLLHSSVAFTELSPNGYPVSTISSSVGLQGFVPPDLQFPRDSFGQKMFLLAQINFVDFDFPKPFPRNGLLQFYLSKSCIETKQNFQGVLSQNNFKVLYFENPIAGKTITDTNAILTSHNFPIQTTQALQFTNTVEPVSLFDYRFDDYIPIEEIHKTSDLYDFNFEDSYLQHYSGAQHKINGYAYFIQEDLRKYSMELQQYNILLLQLISNDAQGIMWGDSGVIKFFINEDDLQKLKFDNALLYVEDYT